MKYYTILLMICTGINAADVGFVYDQKRDEAKSFIVQEGDNKTWKQLTDIHFPGRSRLANFLALINHGNLDHYPAVGASISIPSEPFIERYHLNFYTTTIKGAGSGTADSILLKLADGLPAKEKKLGLSLTEYLLIINGKDARKLRIADPIAIPFIFPPQNYRYAPRGL